jgi:hypothetical protein
VFEYFPGNYVWNLAVVATLNSGGLIDEVDRACRPLRDAAARGEDAGTADFLRVWGRLADSLAAQAEAADKAGQARTAGQLYARATNYLCQAERMQSARAPGRADTYRRVLDLQAKAIARKDRRLSRVAIPYEGTTLPAYFSQAPATEHGPAPVMIMWNGLDSTKEHMYSSGHWAELAARGISALMVDCPGSGEALRLQGLTARVDTEAWAGPCVDYLLTRDDVDPAAIGLAGWSLGGYYAPRAAAFEKRLALVVAWGANHDWGRCSAAGSSARGNGRYRTTGTTCCGCGARTPFRTSSSWLPRSPWMAWSSGSPCRSSSRTGRATGRSRWSTPTGPTTRR